jgi:hypothetical protein
MSECASSGINSINIQRSFEKLGREIGIVSNHIMIHQLLICCKHLSELVVFKKKLIREKKKLIRKETD